MIREIRRVLGLETVNEKLSTLTDIDSRLADISVEIGELAQEYTRRSESRNNVIKSIDSQEILNEVSKRFDLFEKSHLENLLPLKKEKDSLEYEKQSLLKSNEVSELYEFNKKYNRFKAKYKSGEISKETFGTFLKAKHNGKTLYSDILVFNKEGKLLLLQRAAIDDSNPQKWGLPGGHVDPNESHQYAATRELVEETSLYIPELDFVWSFNDKDVHIEYFRADNVCEKEFPIVLQSDEHTDYKWIDIKDIDKYEMPFNMAENIKKALGIKDEIVKSINPDAVKEKIRKVMEEFKNGTLKTPDGKVVADQKQAIAIAISESKKVNKSEQDDLSTFLEPFLKAYKDGIISETALSNVIKARTGKYADTAENRRLKRVGQEYGSKKQDEGNIKDEGKKPENDNTDKPKTNDLAADARNASVAQLEAAIKESPSEEVRQAAHNELARREKEEKPQSEENKKFGEDYENAKKDKNSEKNEESRKKDKETEQPSKKEKDESSVRESKSASDNKEREKKEDELEIRQGIYQTSEYKLSKKIQNILNDRGVKINPTLSETNFGNSIYFVVYPEDSFTPKLKVRISDHGVTNKDRIFNEQHESSKSDPKRIADDIELAMYPERYEKIESGERFYSTYDKQYIANSDVDKDTNTAWVYANTEEMSENKLKSLEDNKDIKIENKEFLRVSKSGNKVYRVAFKRKHELKSTPVYIYKRKEDVEKSEQQDIEKALKGGLADKLSINDIAKKHKVDIKQIKEQVKKGMSVEMEHTDKPSEALEITLDHLTESPVYYDELEKMEKKFDKDKKDPKDE